MILTQKYCSYRREVPLLQKVTSQAARSELPEEYHSCPSFFVISSETAGAELIP